jgi:hypothetical protein
VQQWQRIGILNQGPRIKTAHNTVPDVGNIVLIFMFLIVHNKYFVRFFLVIYYMILDTDTCQIVVDSFLVPPGVIFRKRNIYTE